MVQVNISDQVKPLQEVSLEWMTSTISKNRVMGKDNTIEINIESDNANIDLFANSERAGQAKASNDIESRIVFLWQELVLSSPELDPRALHDFLGRMDEWVSFIPKESTEAPQVKRAF